jgi:hypothetical protein
VITRNLGMQPSVEASYTEMPVAHDDIFVLTSDGVHGELTDQEIAEIAAGANPQRSAERVIDRVLARGAPDNATVVIVPMEERAAVSVLRHRPALARLALFAGVPLLVLILIGIALFAPGHPPAAAPGPSSEETGPRADSGESTTQAPADTTAERTAAMFRPSSPSQARRQQQPAGQRRGRQSRDSTARRPSDTAVQPAEGLDSSGTQRSPQIVPLASPARTLGQQGQDSVVACSLWRVASRCLVDDSVPDPHPLRQTVMEMGAAVGNKQWGAVRGLYNRFDRERNRR